MNSSFDSAHDVTDEIETLVSRGQLDAVGQILASLDGPSDILLAALHAAPLDTPGYSDFCRRVDRLLTPIDRSRDLLVTPR